MKKLVGILVTSSTILLSGCASILSESQYPVSIQSSPSNVDFVLKDEQGRVLQSGKTPMTITLKASDEFFSKAHYTVEYTHNGQTTTTKITPTIDSWYIGNILFGGIIGILIVDPATGAMYELPETATITINDNKSAALQSLKIADINTLSEEQKNKLKPIR